MRTTRNVLLGIALLASAAAGQGIPAARPPLAIETNFPGGAAHVESINPAARSIHIKPPDIPDRGWPCWWYFKVTGVEPGETLTLEVAGGGYALPDRASFSLDNQTWAHTAPGRRTKGSVTWTQKVDAREAWFAWGPPYLPSHAAALIERATKACPCAAAFQLCRTLEDRPVPALRVSQPGAADGERLGVWVQARQHAWESGGSWVCQGFTEWLTSSDPRAESLRKMALVTIVPIMDVDNVVRGAGGKNEKPQDHNRDWSDQPHWRSVEAAERGIKEMNAGGRLALFIDLHNPGPGDRVPFFYTGPRDLMTALQKTNLDDFLAAAKAEMTGPLAISSTTKESGPKYDANWQRISKNWVYRNSNNHVVAVTLETSWNTPHSTPEGYLRVGKELGLAIERHLRSHALKPAP